MTMTSISIQKERLERWLYSRLKESGLNGFLVGVSGGVDSMVCAYMANKVAKTYNIELFTLGLPIESKGRVDGIDVSKIMRETDVPHDRIDLSAAYAEIANLFPEADDITRSNMRTRIRATVLYTYSNIHKLLIVGTINKTELGIGYFQKHAAIGDLLPLGRLGKSQIRELARCYKIPESICIQKASGCAFAPTAEEEWGFSEDAADAVIQKDWTTSNSPDVSERDFRHIFQLNQLSEHKRRFPEVFSP